MAEKIKAKKMDEKLNENLNENLEENQNCQCGCGSNEPNEEATEVNEEAEVLEEDSLKEIENLKAQLEEKDNQLLRLTADFDNFRKRTRLEKEVWRKQIIGDLSGDLLPVLDNLQMALNALEQDEKSKDHAIGVKMINTSLRDVLKKYNVEEISPLGEEFDPKWHEAVVHEPTTPENVGKIVEVLQSGFKIGDKLIRPAIVKVGSAS